ncbi:signal peptidase I [Streptomyces omiyaensis]|uniref:Signal peptidase I n=1 Tax=Streptomyces omiyaensis TaxID=68247 RepID=A0ABW7BLL4_9ACTN
MTGREGTIMRRRGTGGRAKAVGRVMAPLGLVVLLGAVGIFLATHRGVTVMGSSMEPTHRVGDRLTVERGVGPDEVRRGDVVLLHVPDRYGDAPVVQRVVGLGGDRVASDGTGITVNGRPVEEPYVKRDLLLPASEPYDVRVPEGRLFLLGDNRGNARDSARFLDDRAGSVAASAVLGRVRDGLPPAVAATAALGAALLLAGAAAWYAGRRRSVSDRPPVPAPR